MTKKTEELLTKLGASVNSLVAGITEEIERLEEAANAACGGQILPVKQCQVPSSFQHGAIQNFGASNSSYHKPHWSVSAKAARAALAEARDTVDRVHKENAEALRNNEDVARRVKLFMANLGIPESRTTYGYATPKASKMTSKTVTAGYMTDLQAVCIRSDGYPACVQVLDSFEKRITAFEQEAQRKEAEEAAKVKQERAARDKLVLLGALAQKYECAPEVAELLQTWCSLDKYFGLAYWLERNRTNWSEDGCDRAQVGLSYFSVDSQLDQEIADEIQRLVDNWDGDGRVFRDTPHNYGVLYSMVKHPTLMADFEKLRSAGLTPDD